MAVEKLTFGKSLVGLLVDGVADTPYVGSTLRMEEPNGAVIEVPYIQDDPTGQFNPVQAWFSTRTPPENMVLKTDAGDVSLFDVQWSGHTIKSGPGLSLGRLLPTEIVLARREADLSTPLLVSEVRSHVDGLKEWSGFTAISHERKTDDKGLVKKVAVEVQSVNSVEWSQGDAVMTLRTDWRTTGSETPDDPTFGIFEWVVLGSRFAEPRRFFDHLVEQRKVVHLLVLAFDGAIHFRKHHVRDETFTTRLGNGRLINNPFVELISRRTVREYAEKQPTKDDLRQPLVHLRQIGPEGLARWAGEYERWRRFILPTVGVLGRRRVLIEDLVVSLSMSLEAGGHLIGEREGEMVTYRRGRTTTATYVYRCLHSLNVDWGDRVESIVGLARAAANTYNSIKHFDRGEFPENDETYLVSIVLREVVRLMVLDILDPSGGLLRNFRDEESLWRIHESFRNSELRILDDGGWERALRPEERAVPEGMTLN
ncbi:hypothetical protein ACFRJ8_19035 [Arthrobacter sp. NPDC056886]|uniref:ApeA N-terminal domain 1-containing protein n=1 Tax=Arthrobacter sp. NPDC056886 TaxID=3345960 RepID=UPI00366CBDC1